VSGRIDLGARLGPVLTACIGVTTRGVRASRLMHEVPGRRRRRVRTFERFGTHDRSVLAERSRYGTRTPRRLMSFTSGALTTSGSDHVGHGVRGRSASAISRC